MFFCRHKYGKIDDGFQYCEKCGVALVAPTKECQHVWEQIDELRHQNSLTGKIFKRTWILRCKKCGEMKQESTG